MSDEWDLEKALGHKFQPHEIEIIEGDSIGKSFGIGTEKVDPLKSVLTHRTSVINIGRIPGVPKGITALNTLQAEEVIEVFKPLVAGRKAISQETVKDIIVKKKASIIIVENKITDKKSGDKLASIITSMFAKSGGSTPSGTYKNLIPKSPTSEPPFNVYKIKTTTDDAQYFRLQTSAENIHPLPQAGTTPYLHGLYTLSLTAAKILLGKDVRKLQVKFTGIVLAGDTLEISEWKNGTFEVKTRGKVVMFGHYQEGG